MIVEWYPHCKKLKMEYEIRVSSEFCSDFYTPFINFKLAFGEFEYLESPNTNIFLKEN